jgi:GT2 family glycosyltransferase
MPRCGEGAHTIELVSEPAIAVVVPSHERPLRLRWLLNALEDQTLERPQFEVIVCHDSRGPETERLLRSHPLATAGTLRSTTLRSGRNPPGLQRNVAWRAARAPLIAFTDDDCRPPADWLERALAAAKANPGAIVQGATRPDPDELSLLHAAAHSRTQLIEPPVGWAQTCNIVYPREVLERAGGFDERLEGGEDADLAWRARSAGVELVGAPEVLTYHAVEAQSLPAALRSSWRWRHLPAVVGRHPQLRVADSFGGLFWKPRHAWLTLGIAGAALASAARRPALAGAALVPWALSAAPVYGSSWRGRARSALELPAQAAIDGVELAALATGSIRHRTVFL